MLFINTTQHELSTEQVGSIHNFMSQYHLTYDGIVNLKDIEPNLFARLSNTPEDDQDRTTLVVEFAKFINKTDAMFHLPIGSPAFQFQLASFLQWRFVNSNGKDSYKICMSHTKRISEEVNGVKTSRFQFERFIRVE